MHILVCLDADPLRSLPIWAAFTDAQSAIPGLKITVLGALDIVQCIKVHPAVTGSLVLDEQGLKQQRWRLGGWRARHAVKSACAALTQPPAMLIDPFGTPITRAAARAIQGRRVGITDLLEPGRDRDYSSVFPLPPELHPLQALRVLFAAALGYSLHDLAPLYGLEGLDVARRPSDAESLSLEHQAVDLIVDPHALPWDNAQYQQFQNRMAETGLRVVYLDEFPGARSAKRLCRNWLQISTANYVLTGLNATAWLAAALGRPGLCVCSEGTAASDGVISSRRAQQKIINLDQPPFNQPHIVVESIIQVLARCRPPAPR